VVTSAAWRGRRDAAGPILAHLHIARAHVVGRDWDAALTWVLASLAPGTVDHLVTLSVGHPPTFRHTLQRCEKSWYMLLSACGSPDGVRNTGGSSEGLACR
jgi:pimeloyl-ACP methyl ester carboxylesterase